MLFLFGGGGWGGGNWGWRECCEGSQGAQGALAAVSPPPEWRSDHDLAQRRPVGGSSSQGEGCEICALLAGRNQMEGDRVVQTEDHSKLEMKQHLAESLTPSPPRRPKKTICVDEGVSVQKEENPLLDLGEEFSYRDSLSLSPSIPPTLSKTGSFCFVIISVKQSTWFCVCTPKACEQASWEGEDVHE